MSSKSSERVIGVDKFCGVSFVPVERRKSCHSTAANASSLCFFFFFFLGVLGC